MVYIYFIYGLSFFSFGMAVLLYPKMSDSIKALKNFWMLGMFGILHGINEWIDMFIYIEHSKPLSVEIIGFIILPLSFSFLLYYGLVSISEKSKRFSHSMIVSLMLMALILFLFLSFQNANLFLAGNIWARYIFGVFGIFLTSYALYMQTNTYGISMLPLAKLSLIVLSTAFFMYGIFSAIVVPNANILSASIINYTFFQDTFGAPVQLFRAASAFVSAIAAIMLFKILRTEVESNLIKLSRAIEQGGDSIIITDKDGIVEYVNPAFEEQSGFTKQEAIGKKPNIIKSSSHPASFYEQLWKTIVSKKIYKNQIINKNKNGKLFYEYKTIAPIKNTAGDITHYVATGKDITELHEQKERFSEAVNGTQDGLWDWNMQTDEVYFSPIWKKMLGYEDDELNNSFETWKNNVHPDDIDKVMSDIDINNTTPGVVFENIHRLRHKNGSWIWVLNRGKTIFDENGKAIRMVGFQTDITKQKKLEEQVKKQNDIMMSQSRHAAMGEMISMIAHQWRQPLSAISMGANNMLVDIELDSMEATTFKKMLHNILSQIQHLSKTIDDFRNFLKPDKDKHNATVISVVNDVLSIMDKTLKNNNIEVFVDSKSNTELLIYSRELLQVFLNIINNAKDVFVEKDSEYRTIKVEIYDENDCVITTICDNGGGIKDNVINRIFEPYFTTKDKLNGTGLGLYMSKTIVEEHLHGSLDVYNSNEGVCFKISIPVEKKVNI